jgi:hypothetical protein
MLPFTGRFRFLDTRGAVIQEGSCQAGIEGGSLRLIPASGAPLACDLGDIDAYAPGDYEISLKLYTGNTILLTHFAKAFQNLSHDLLEAYRARIVQCLLLEDLEEVGRFDGWAQLDSGDGGFLSRSEIRLYRSNFAILPETATGFSWRYADIDSVDFDEPTYTLGIRSGSDRLILTRLAKRTRELTSRLQEGIAAVSDRGAKVIQSTFPFLTPDQFLRVAGAFKEGRAVAIRELHAIHPQIERALLAGAVDANLRTYLDLLKDLSVENGYYAGFKEIRKETAEGEDSESGAGAEGGAPAEEGAAAEPELIQCRAQPTSENGPEKERGTILHWFFFPLKSDVDPAVVSNAVAWEATSASGRATYFFRLLPPAEAGVLKKKALWVDAVDAAVRRLNRAIVTLNFRREPIYLPDDSLQMQERYRRYAIACRKIPLLRELRGSFLGRALHSSPETWQKQVRAILAKSS